MLEQLKEPRRHLSRFSIHIQKQDTLSNKSSTMRSEDRCRWNAHPDRPKPCVSTACWEDFKSRAPVSWGQPQAVSSRVSLSGSHSLDIENKCPVHAISSYGPVFGECIFRTPRHKKCCASWEHFHCVFWKFFSKYICMCVCVCVCIIYIIYIYIYGMGPLSTAFSELRIKQKWALVF